MHRKEDAVVTAMALVKPIRHPFVEAPGDRERARRLAHHAVERGIDSVYFIGCGGSLSAFGPIHYMLDCKAADFTAFEMTSNEFNYRRPRHLGSRSLVVVASSTGTTPETLAAIETARTAQVPAVIGLTTDAESPLAKAVDDVFAYGVVKTAWDPRGILLAHMGHGLLEASGVVEDARAIADAYDALPEALPRAIEETEGLCRDIAGTLQAEPIIYVLGAGPLESTAHLLSMCYLQEMQWIHSASFNAGEFLHGALEVVTDDVAFIVFLGEDETRPMGERALSFLNGYTHKVHVIDSRNLSLPGVPESVRAEIAPIALGAIVTRLAQHFEAARDHDLATRRYMFTVEY